MSRIKTKEDLIKHTHIKEEEFNMANECMSMAYLLYSIANEYSESSAEIMKKRGMSLFRIRYLENNLRKAFDLYNREISELIELDESKKKLMDQYDDLTGIIKLYLEDEPGNWNWELRYYMMYKMYLDLKKNCIPVDEDSEILKKLQQ